MTCVGSVARQPCGQAGVPNQNKTRTKRAAAARLACSLTLDWPGSSALPIDTMPSAQRRDATGNRRDVPRGARQMRSRTYVVDVIVSVDPDWSLSVSRSGCTRDGAGIPDCRLFRWNCWNARVEMLSVGGGYSELGGKAGAEDRPCMVDRGTRLARSPLYGEAKVSSGLVQSEIVGDVGP